MNENKTMDKIRDYRKPEKVYTPEELRALQARAYAVFGDMEVVRRKLRKKNRENIYLAFKGGSMKVAKQVEQLINDHENKLLLKKSA